MSFSLRRVLLPCAQAVAVGAPARRKRVHGALRTTQGSNPLLDLVIFPAASEQENN
jgi:hypothetical protein